MGAWVEIVLGGGLCTGFGVAPFVGAWVEIDSLNNIGSGIGVAPFVGAWVEILALTDMLKYLESLPLWERGLKFIPGFMTAACPRRSLCGSVG